jgi:hypothetical protein
MAKGAESKNKITQKILETFAGSFINDKEIRIPMVEDGAEVQIKVVLTCAKTNVNPGDDVALPGENVSSPVVGAAAMPATAAPTVVEPTAEEKANLSKLLATLGMN